MTILAFVMPIVTNSLLHPGVSLGVTVLYEKETHNMCNKAHATHTVYDFHRRSANQSFLQKQLVLVHSRMLFAPRVWSCFVLKAVLYMFEYGRRVPETT